MSDTQNSPNINDSEGSEVTQQTTVRLKKQQHAGLDEIALESHHSKNGLIQLAVDALIDHVRRTGKLPLPRILSKKRSPKSKDQAPLGR